VRLPPILARFETATLLLVVAIAAAAWAFFGLAGEMREGELEAFDRAVMMALRNPADPADPLGPPAVELMMRDITALGGVAVLTLVSAVVTLDLLLRRRWRHALLLPVAVAGGQILSNVAKAAYGRPRPDLVPHGVDVVSASFPSGHSMMAAAVYLTLAAMLAKVEPDRRLKALYLGTAMAVIVLVGISRVYLGVHWPSDVLAGWAAGAGWALICNLAARRLIDDPSA
jgi:undecaprenyl-diphosphatase